MHSHQSSSGLTAILIDELLVILVVPIWAFDYSVVKIALRDIDPLFYATLRFAIASVILAVTWLIRDTPNYSKRDWIRIIAAGFSGVVLYQIGFTFGLRLISASESSLLITVSPILTALMATVMQKKSLTWRQILGGVIAFLGVGLVVWNGLQGALLSWISLGGYLLTLLSALSLGFRSVVLQPTLECHHVLPTVTLMILVGTIMLLPFSAKSPVTVDWQTIETSAWLAISYGAVFSTSVGYVLWYYGIGKIGAVRTMIYYYFVPLLAVVFAILVLGEQIGLLHFAGGAAIIGGVVLARSSDITISFKKAFQTDGRR